MINASDFVEYYKTISNTELLSILENATDYQPIAIEAAKNEFANRQLSETEIYDAKEPLLKKKLQEEKQLEKLKKIEAKVKQTGTTIIDTLNPIQSSIPTTEKTIRYIILVYSGIFLYQLIRDFEMIRANMSDITRFPYESLLFLIPFIIFPIAIITFWKRKSIGWILFTIFLTSSIVGVLWGLFLAITWKNSSNGFDILFPRPSLISFIIHLIFLGGTQFVICKQNIREIFSISQDKLLMTIGITGVLSFFIYYGVS
jgi:hypothetical protein